MNFTKMILKKKKSFQNWPKMHLSKQKMHYKTPENKREELLKYLSDCCGSNMDFEK